METTHDNYAIGDVVRFEYHNTPREGEVVQVKPTCITLQMGEVFRSFCYHKIHNMEHLHFG